MDIWVVVALIVIIATTLYSYYRQLSYSLVASVACAALFAMMVGVSDASHYTHSTTFVEMAFTPKDLIDTEHFYTVCTSMFTHADFGHLLMNILGLAFLGTIFEQRIGVRHFIVIYILAGVCGTLLLAALRWNDTVFVVGASGAISGILGAFARMFPNERMMIIFIPFIPMRTWTIVGLFLLLQIFYAIGSANIAVEAHVGGLVAGLATAPYVVKMPLHRRVKKMISLNALRRLARTPELKAIIRRLEDEEIADVRSAWIEEFLSKAKCPHCGARIRISRETITCERGHML
ncbi:MAG: rhomboid family intramembrane serine protease [Methanobacteriota archaeon]|nr:MAG: rhomboid family intramembrane serine protease [Euryarchaeota archaeon]